MSRFKTGVLKNEEELRIGFLPTTDCAPLVYAKEAGLFEQRGLAISLVRETSWSAVGEKVANGDLDMAQAPAPVPFLTNLGIDSDVSACVSPMVMSLQGSGITVSTRLWNEGVRDAVSLLEFICRHWGRRTVTLGVPSVYSTQCFLLEQWLRGGGVDSRNQVRMVAVPSEQMYATLKLGYVDLFCAPEPWNSVAVHAGQGVCVATSPELAPLHPETVLITRQSLATGRGEQLEQVVSALLEACVVCDQPQHRGYLSGLLSHPQYVNAPRDCLAAGFAEEFRSGRDEPLEAPTPLFHRYLANYAGEDRSTWVINQLYDALNAQAARRKVPEKIPILRNVFRKDVFEKAAALPKRESLRLAANA